MIRNYRKYPLSYRYAYRLGIEKEIIPKEVRMTIPRSTIHAWRNSNIDHAREHLGLDKRTTNTLSRITEEQIFFNRQRKLLAVKSLKIATVIKEELGEREYKRFLNTNKALFVEIIEENADFIGQSLLLKLFGISPNLLAEWKSQLIYSCTASSNSLCMKKHPNQLGIREINIIQESLNDPMYQGWSLKAICEHLTLTREDFAVCKTTFYKYVRRMQGGDRGPWKRPTRGPGIRANKPNEVWHIDISVYRTKDGTRNYFYCLMDNYSRLILNHRLVLEPANKKIIGELLTEEIGKLTDGAITIVSDGGPENNNHYLKKLLLTTEQETGVAIQLCIAQKDIDSSNSMIERLFRLIKGDYIYRNHPANHKELALLLLEVIREYNYVRPHNAFQYQTPYSVYRGECAPDLSEKKKRIQVLRRSQNKSCSCLVCTCQ